MAINKQSLLKTIYQNEADLHRQVAAHISAGADLNVITEYSESALRVSSNNGRFDVVKLLLDSGADISQLQWSTTHLAVAFGSVGDLRRAVAESPAELEERDFWRRTPFLLSILRGDIDKATALLELGADQTAVGRCGKTIFQYAIQSDDVVMLDWLVRNGFDLASVDEFETTPLIAASESGKTKSVRYLLEKSVDIFQRNHIPQRAIEVASNLEIVRLLVSHGDDINDVSEEMHQAITGTGQLDGPTVSREVYLEEKYRRFGQANPEEISSPFWTDMIKSGVSAWRARDKYKDTAINEPVWSFQRFGRTTNILSDGRIIEIAGEHEDHYDPDFCIYNDVVVFETDKTVRVFCYPEAVFPPTDFHTATLVDGYIFIIGSLGYPESRCVGHTPVFKLDVKTMKISKVSTDGEAPGWISNHKTALCSGGLVVSGGEVWVEAESGFDLVANSCRYTLNLDSLTWTKQE